MKKMVVYTCVIGQGLESLHAPTVDNEEVDFVCFSNDPSLGGSGIWKIRPMPKQTKGLSEIKAQKYVKINPHEILPEYEVSIYVDPSIEINCKISDFYMLIGKKDHWMYVQKNTRCDCAYVEALSIISNGLDSMSVVGPQMEFYHRRKFPSHFGLPNTNIIIRNHNNEDCKELMRTWWDEVKNKSYKDQLSFGYSVWATKSEGVCSLSDMFFFG